MTGGGGAVICRGTRSAGSAALFAAGGAESGAKPLGVCHAVLAEAARPEHVVAAAASGARPRQMTAAVAALQERKARRAAKPSQATNGTQWLPQWLLRVEAPTSAHVAVRTAALQAARCREASTTGRGFL